MHWMRQERLCQRYGCFFVTTSRRCLSEYQERERAVETAASASQHAELIERINQLNILRESNATLRADCEKHAKRTRELEIKLKRVSAELEPVKEKSRTSQAELEASKAHVVRLEEENRRWQERNAQLLSKVTFFLRYLFI